MDTVSFEDRAIFESALCTACDKHIAEGGTIISGAFHSTTLLLCPIGAIFKDEKNISTYSNDISNLLKINIPHLSMWGFVCGFDNSEYCDSIRNNDPEMFDLGIKLRLKYQPKKLWETLNTLETKDTVVEVTKKENTND